MDGELFQRIAFPREVMLQENEVNAKTTRVGLLSRDSEKLSANRFNGLDH